MESREMLRRWSISDWPHDDFTLEDNRRDLEMHQREHETGKAFTYTVLAPDRLTCLGCVYIKPLAPLFEKEFVQCTSDHPKNGARVAFWVRSSRLTDNLDGRLLRELIEWFDREWSFDSLVFFTSDLEARQQRIFQQAGLRRLFSKTLEGAEGQYIVYL